MTRWPEAGGPTVLPTNEEALDALSRLRGQARRVAALAALAAALGLLLLVLIAAVDARSTDFIHWEVSHAAVLVPR